MTHSREILDAMFTKVCNADDWKEPINALCPVRDIDLVSEAVIFFTATVPHFELSDDGKFYIVTADGYRAGPAGDH